MGLSSKLNLIWVVAHTHVLQEGPVNGKAADVLATANTAAEVALRLVRPGKKEIQETILPPSVHIFPKKKKKASDQVRTNVAIQQNVDNGNDFMLGGLLKARNFGGGDALHMSLICLRHDSSLQCLFFDPHVFIYHQSSISHNKKIANIWRYVQSKLALGNSLLKILPLLYSWQEIMLIILSRN